MATKSLLPVQVTLCFLLALVAQGIEAASVLAVVSGKAQCSNNPSMVISNAPMHVVINGTTVIGTSETTSSGKFSVMMNVTSKDQLNSLVSSGKAVITAAPGACPSDAAVATTLAAPVRPLCFFVIVGTTINRLRNLLDDVVDGPADVRSSAAVTVDMDAGRGLPIHKTPMDHEEASDIIQNHLSAMKKGDEKMGLMFMESGQFLATN